MSGSPARSAEVAGRATRTALLAVLAALIGGNLFDEPDDPWPSAISFVLVVFATSALTTELTGQAQRGRADPANKWTRTDTVIALTLGAISSLLAISFAFSNAPAGEHTAAACFATLYVFLIGYFSYVRGKTLRVR